MLRATHSPFSYTVSPQSICVGKNTPNRRHPRTGMVHASALFSSPPSTKDQLGSKYAVIEVGGGQQIVEEGRSYSCNRLNVPPGSTVKLPRVIALKQDGEFTVGEPYLENARVEAEIEEEYRGTKLIVFKYRPKKHYRRTQGHRQELTKFKITRIAMEE